MCFVFISLPLVLISLCLPLCALPNVLRITRLCSLSNGRVQPHMERSGACRLNPLLGFATVCHSDDHIALFVSFVHVSVGLGHLFQRIASINDWLDPSRLNQIFEEQ